MSQYAEYWQGTAIRNARKRFYVTMAYPVGDWWVVSLCCGGCTNNIRKTTHHFFDNEKDAIKFYHWKIVEKERDGYH